MASIDFNSFSIATTTGKIKSFRTGNMEDLKRNVEAKRYLLPSNVLYRYEIAERIKFVENEISIIQRDLEIIEGILALACEEYNNVEETLEGYVSNLEYDAGGFNASQLFRRILSNNELLFRSSKTLVFGNLEIKESVFRNINVLYRNKKKVGDFVVNTGIPVFKVGAHFIDKYDEIHSSFKTLADAIAFVVGVADDDSTLAKALFKEVELPDKLVDIVDYANTTVEYIEAIKNKDYALATSKAVDLGTDILCDVVTEGTIQKTAFRMGQHMGENAVNSYIEYADNPNLETFGSMIYSSTIKGAWQGATETAYDIVDDIPVMGTWVKNSYEQLSDKTGLDAVFDVQSKLMDELFGQGFNGWVDGVKLIGNRIDKEIDDFKGDVTEAYNSAKDYVVNGFSSILTRFRK